jgi:hypothetical protein
MQDRAEAKESLFRLVLKLLEYNDGKAGWMLDSGTLWKHHNDETIIYVFPLLEGDEIRCIRFSKS